METERPIFDIISENTTSGHLPDGFKLPDTCTNEENAKIKMAPGAMDGIVIYHMGHSPLNEEDISLIAEAVHAISDGNNNAAELIREFGRKHRAIAVIDEFQQYIRRHAGELNQTQLYRFAVQELMAKSHDAESVKYGLMITELFGDCHEYIKNIIRTLSLYDEFSIFAVWNMLLWKNGNDEIFQLVKKVTGWGRVHAIEQLKPESQEIRDWLLYEGIKNDVVPAYSARTVMEKSGALELLAGTLTKKEFSAVSEIISGLLDEGPVQGISAFENADEILLQYLSQTDHISPDLSDYETILEILNYAERNEDHAEVKEAAEKILHSPSCTDTIMSALPAAESLELAKVLGIPYKDQLLATLQNDFDRYYTACRYLTEDPAYLDRVLEIYRENIPPASIEADPQNEIGLREAFKQNSQLDLLLQELRSRPLAGEDYLMHTISAVTVRNRSLTLRTLKAWVHQKQMSLRELSSPLYQRLAEAYQKEVRDDLKESIRKLLDGVTEFPPQEL